MANYNANMYIKNKFCRRCEAWFLRTECDIMCPQCNHMLRVSPRKGRLKQMKVIEY